MRETNEQARRRVDRLARIQVLAMKKMAPRQLRDWIKVPAAVRFEIAAHEYEKARQ